LDIGSSTAITILGTVATGTWQGTTLAVGYGGTGLTSYASGDVIYASGSTTLAKLAKGSDGQVLTLASGVPSWATPTVGDITAVTAGNGLSGGGTSGAVSLALDLNELTAATIDVANDSIAIIDANDSDTSKKESIADLMSAVDGTGLTASSGVLSVDASQTQITAVGTIATGTWSADTIAVNKGGTGATSLTDGGVLLGSGTGAITAMSALGDGVIVIGDGSGDPTTLDVGSSSAITILGTIATGVWNGTSIGTGYTDAKVTSVVAGTLVDVSATTGAVTVNVDLSELATSTSDGDGDFFVVVDDSNAQKKLTKGNIDLAGFGGTASSATLASTITVTANNTTDETVYPLFVDGATGTQGAESDTGLTYNPSSGILTTTQVTGNLVGNVTGDVSGSSATTTLASTVTVVDSSDTTAFPAFFDSATGSLAIKTDASNLTYNASTGVLSSGGLVVPDGSLTLASTAVTSTGAELNILDGVTSTTAELNILDGVTSTTAELNILDGVTSTAAELNILDGVTSSTAELNILDGVTSTTAELNILDGATVVVGEINYLDLGATAVGNAIASKAVVLDANKDYTGVRNFTLTGELQATNIGYTDGDNAIVIADGGGITASAGITSTASANTFGSTSFNDANITNVGDIALDTISSDAGTTVSVTLGTDAGDNFVVGNNSAFVVEGDTDFVGIGTDTPACLLYLTDANDGITAIGNARARAGIWMNTKSGTGAGMAQGVTDGGYPVIQGMYTDDSTARTLYLAPYGGGIALPPAGKLYLDGGSNTYLTESAADTISVYTAGDERYIFGGGGNPYLRILAGNTGVGAVQFYEDDGGSGQVLHWQAGVRGADNNFYISENATIHSSYALMISNSQDVTVGGALAKGSGSFKIDHPIKEDSLLVHSFLEGPRCDLLYRDSVELHLGTASVDMDEVVGLTDGTWEALCREPQVFVQNESGWSSVKGAISGSTLIISCEDTNSTDTVSWMVVAERHDDNIKGASWTDDDGKPILEPLKEA
tara:strand:- start:1631 stop:4657 length:3027 start_codon:yes stop_codon:yes gene_type:complete